MSIMKRNGLAAMSQSTYSKTFGDRFVSEQIEARGVRDPLVLDAMRKVPRETLCAEGTQERGL